MTRWQANVMLAYPIDEAEELLSNRLAAAKQSFANCEEDLDFLREQITVRLLHFTHRPHITGERESCRVERD